MKAYLSAAVALTVALGCSTVGDRAPASRPKVRIEALFVASDHPLGDCLRGDLASSYLTDPDSVLFYDRDSKLRVTPPTAKGATTYHAHLFHRAGGELFDFVQKQDAGGLIEIDLGRFDQPEELVVVSAARRLSAQDAAGADPIAVLERPSELITPPYVLSFKLLPRAGNLETILPQNPHRYEVETSAGTLTLVTSSFSRRDQLLTLIDPQMTLGGLIAEDPYIYVRGTDGAVPPRLSVEVFRPGSKDPWEKAATYHIPEAADPLRPGDRPFLLRTSKRDLIAFAPPARVDLEFPSEPPQTSALVKARFTGVREGDVLKFVVSCAYPSGPKGGYGAVSHSGEVTSNSGTLIETCDLGHLDPANFPLVASVAHRLVTPWKLTGGRFAPEPPLGKSTIPTAAPELRTPSYSKLLAPRYASHFDVLAFRGAGTLKKDTILMSYHGNSDGPDDPNVAPPPPAPSPMPPGTNPDPSSSIVRGFPFQGGPDSVCGCGKDGKSCPNMQAPCRGHCGQACPGNGCCKAGPMKDGGAITLRFPCPPKGRSCGMAESECTCGPHEWDRESIRGAVLALLQAIPGFADLDGPNVPIGFAPCHRRTHVADVTGKFWVGGMVGAGAGGPQQALVTYHVYVTFKPCIHQPDDDKEKKQPPTTKGKPGSKGNSGGIGGSVFEAGSGLTISVGGPQPAYSTVRVPATDVNSSLYAARAAQTLGILEAGSTLSLFPDLIHVDLETLAGIRSWKSAIAAVASTAWLARPVNTLDGPDSWTAGTPTTAWAAYQQASTSIDTGTGRSGGGAIAPPPLPSPSPPFPSPTPPTPSAPIRR
jgi:hypothetical protein